MKNLEMQNYNGAADRLTKLSDKCSSDIVLRGDGDASNFKSAACFVHNFLFSFFNYGMLIILSM